MIPSLASGELLFLFVCLFALVAFILKFHQADSRPMVLTAITGAHWRCLASELCCSFIYCANAAHIAANFSFFLMPQESNSALTAYGPVG